MKAGLEVHQQLAGSKLYCACPTELSETVEGTVSRRLRPAGGEERQVDSAAAFQASRRLLYRYELAPPSCLVELDEEPPKPLNEEALDTALTVALLLGCRPVDEVAVMRKIVVDGSNTSGFQRTALVAVDGAIEVGGRRHTVLSVCLEEDAARKVGERDGELAYRLDRLGIPLIEIATGPTIENGAEAKALAQEIGALLRATRRVRRGIGTIREDLNVSTEGGRRIEIKGVQELRLIDSYVEREVGRQEHLLRVRDDLIARRAQVPDEIVDVTDQVEGASNSIVRAAVRDGGVVLAVRLPGFAGLLGRKGTGDERLGRELADYARTAGVGGILHTDELPGSGFAAQDVDRLRASLALGTDDAFALVVDGRPERARRAAERVRDRARAALEGIPGETRDPLPGGRTRYSRPIPGRDRMYPETDIPPIPITAERLDRLRAALPERPGETIDRIGRAHGISLELAGQIVYGGELDRFEPLVARGHAAGRVARLLTQELPEAAASASEGFDPSLSTLDELLAAETSGRFAKEGLAKVLAELARGAESVDAALAATGLTGMGRPELEAIVGRLVAANSELVRTRGEEAFSALMGDVMKEVRGRRDGREVAEVLRHALRTAQEGPARRGG
jgi:glutamyl-tRNA(Gln) amidotransferase subunit E